MAIQLIATLKNWQRPKNFEEKIMAWEQCLSKLWETMDEHTEQNFLVKMEQLIEELPTGNFV